MAMLSALVETGDGVSTRRDRVSPRRDRRRNQPSIIEIGDGVSPRRDRRRSQPALDKVNKVPLSNIM